MYIDDLFCIKLIQCCFRVKARLNEQDWKLVYKLCGRRIPFKSIIRQHIAQVTLIQTTYNSVVQVKFSYQVVDKGTHQYFSVLYERTVFRFHKRYHFHLGFSVLHHDYSWVHTFHFSAEPGDTIQFQTFYYTQLTGEIEIYDGFESLEVYKITELRTDYWNTTNSTYLNKTSSYYISYMRSACALAGLTKESQWLLELERVHTNVQTISQPYFTSFHNTETLPFINQRFVVHYNVTDEFPQLALNIRLFSGHDEGMDCIFGGVGIKLVHQVYETTDVGPYCNDVLQGRTLLETLNITFSNEVAVIFIYALWPYYKIDLDFNVRTTLCEGIINPITLCWGQSKFHGQSITSGNYRFRCVDRHWKLSEIILFEIKRCLVIQQLSVHDQTKYIVEVKSFADMLIYVKSFNIQQKVKYYDKLLTLQIDMWPKQFDTKIIQGKHLYKNIGLMKVFYSKPSSPNELFFTIKITPKAEQTYCPKYNESSHSMFNITDLKTVTVAHLISILSICGFATYRAEYVYFFVFNPTAKRGYSYPAHMICLSVYSNISNASTRSDRLTIGIGKLSLLTVPVLNVRRNFSLPFIRYFVVIDKTDVGTWLMLDFALAPVIVSAKWHENRIVVSTCRKLRKPGVTFHS